MTKVSKYDQPTTTYPYKIRRRLNMLSVPRRIFYESMEGMPGYSEMGIRKSALRGVPTDRVNDISWPYVRRLMLIKRMYKHRFGPERMERIDRMIEAANATMYTKLANCVQVLKKADSGKESKKKKGWSESEWKKHMDYISNIAAAKKQFDPPPIKRGKTMPLEALLPRIREISSRPSFKCYIRQSKDQWYRDPVKQAVRKTVKMGVGRFTPHPHKVPRRIVMLSEPKKSFMGRDEGMPTYTKLGTRKSALRGQLTNSDIAWPHLRCLLHLKRMYRKRFSAERLQKLDQMIEAANATMYSKLANCTIDLKKQEKDSKKSKAWSAADWKKHMDRISQIATPKKVFEPRPMKRGKPVPLETLLPRLNVISSPPDFKCYKKESEEPWYKDPLKVSPNALKYQITERTKKLAEAKVTQTGDF